MFPYGCIQLHPQYFSLTLPPARPVNDGANDDSFEPARSSQGSVRSHANRSNRVPSQNTASRGDPNPSVPVRRPGD